MLSFVGTLARESGTAWSLRRCQWDPIHPHQQNHVRSEGGQPGQLLSSCPGFGWLNHDSSGRKIFVMACIYPRYNILCGSKGAGFLKFKPVFQACRYWFGKTDLRKVLLFWGKSNQRYSGPQQVRIQDNKLKTTAKISTVLSFLLWKEVPGVPSTPVWKWQVLTRALCSCWPLLRVQQRAGSAASDTTLTACCRAHVAALGPTPGISDSLQAPARVLSWDK